MKRLFVDMDGVLARFHEHNDCLERMDEKGFFKNLNAYENVVEALDVLFSFDSVQDCLELWILSSIYPYCYYQVKEEKIHWLQHSFSKNLRQAAWENNMIFPVINDEKTKADYIKEHFGEINADFFLLDDYSCNLRGWKAAGGTSIKLVNDINDKGTNGPLWDGKRIRYDYEPHRFATELKEIIFGKEK